MKELIKNFVAGLPFLFIILLVFTLCMFFPNFMIVVVATITVLFIVTMLGEMRKFK